MDYLITETHADTKKNWKLLTVDPEWSDSGAPAYSESYQMENPGRTKIHDEKTRAG